jgi:hypothetical protein
MYMFQKDIYISKHWHLINLIHNTVLAGICGDYNTSAELNLIPISLSSL